MEIKRVWSPRNVHLQSVGLCCPAVVVYTGTIAGSFWVKDLLMSPYLLSDFAHTQKCHLLTCLNLICMTLNRFLLLSLSGSIKLNQWAIAVVGSADLWRAVWISSTYIHANLQTKTKSQRNLTYKCALVTHFNELSCSRALIFAEGSHVFPSELLGSATFLSLPDGVYVHVCIIQLCIFSIQSHCSSALMSSADLFLGASGPNTITSVWPQ